MYKNHFQSEKCRKIFFLVLLSIRNTLESTFPENTIPNYMYAHLCQL